MEDKIKAVIVDETMIPTIDTVNNLLNLVDNPGVLPGENDVAFVVSKTATKPNPYFKHIKGRVLIVGYENGQIKSLLN